MSNGKLRVVFYITLACLCVVLILLSYRVYKNNRLNSEVYSKMDEDRVLLSSIQIEQLKLLDFNQVDICGMDVRNINGDVFAFSDSLVNDKTLVMCISSFNCKECVDFVTQHISMINDQIGIRSFIILAENYLSKDIYLFAKSNGISNSFYFPQNNEFQGKIASINMPMMFVVHKNNDNNISHIFIPHKESPEQFVDYVEMVRLYLHVN